MRSCSTTICVTHYQRPESLQRCIKSIQQYYPDLPFYVKESDGNVSRARNEMLQEVATPYALLLEEDFEIVPSTSIPMMLDVINHDNFIIAGGDVFGKVRTLRHTLTIEKPYLKSRFCRPNTEFTLNGTPFQRCDLVAQFGIINVQAAREIGWDPDLCIGEHREWFYRIKLSDWKVAYCPSVRIKHHHDHPTNHYHEMRNRSREFNKKAEEKIGLRFI